MKSGKVYFVGAPGRVKIGYTVNPDDRLGKLRQADMEQLSVLLVVDGTRKLEAHLHKTLAPYLIKGEWFRDCAAVRRAMDDCRSAPLVDPDETKPGSALDELIFVREASRICLQLHDAARRNGATASEAISLVALKTGLSHNRVWQLRYRSPNSVTAGELLALRGHCDAVRAAKALVDTHPRKGLTNG
jgi:hypothetical protein